MLYKLSKHINKLMPYRVRIIKSKLGKTYIDSRGANRIVNEILNHSVIVNDMRTSKNVKDNLRLRKADKDDCLDLWIWRNHPDVRRWSFDVKEISYGNHRAWLDNKLKDKNTKIYIAEDKKLGKVGQIRFEINKNGSTYVNINLNPKFFGEGFGNKIIKKATAAFMKEKSMVKEITAQIVDGNIASKKAFQKAGYVFLSNIIKNGKHIAVFKFKSDK